MRLKMLALVAALGVLMAPSASASLATESAIGENAWLERRVLNIAHQGGEIEAPSNTLFAFKTAQDKGADVLELDVHAAADGELVVIHDPTVNRTTDGRGRVDQMTVEQLKKLDAAYWFVPDCGTCNDDPVENFAYRGYATGATPLPEELAGFEPNDFRIPTLREVLKEFPRELINIEIKATAPQTKPYEDKLAALLREFGRSSDTIVVSFLDPAVEMFDLLAPEVDTATGTAEAGAFWASSQGPLPGSPSRHQALQVPITFNGAQIVSEDFVADAHANGIAVHVWTINDRAEMEWLIDIGVDGIMTDRPTLLEEVIGAAHVKYKAPKGKPSKP